MSKRSPGSKAQMKIGKERYRKERDRYRQKLVQRKVNQDMIANCEVE